MGDFELKVPNMLFSKDKNLDDLIVSGVICGKRTVKGVHEYVVNNGPNVSLRAVYKSLNKLIDAGVVVKVSTRLHISADWIKKVRDTVGFENQLPDIAPGESIRFELNSVAHIDAYWKTIVASIHPSKNEHIYFYNPHNYWLYEPSRLESEREYYASFKNEKRYGFFTVGGTTSIDKKFKRQYGNEYLQIDLREVTSFKRTDHITVVGDYVITVRIDNDVAESLDAIYTSDQPIDEKESQIRRVLSVEQKIVIKIENAPHKAVKVRNTLKRNFYIPKV